MPTGMQLAAEMYDRRTVQTASGEMVPLNSEIPSAMLEALHRQVLAIKPDNALEVGLANGLSALGILSALEEVGNGRLISIDPKQTASWQGAAITAIHAAGLSERHTLVEDYDYNALPMLLRDGLRIQFAYIDGWHTFDYTLLDFFYADKMLDVGGVIAFNDCSWPAINKVLRFLKTHRNYEELDLGLKGRPTGPTAPVAIRALLLGRRGHDRYFRKLDDVEPNWDFFRSF